MGVVGKAECAAAAAHKRLQGTELRAQHSSQRTLVGLQVVSRQAAAGCK